VTDVHPSDVRLRREALDRVRSLLTELGCSDDEIDRAVADDVVDLLVVDRLVVPAGRRLTQTEMAEITDLPVDAIRRLWRALGFLDVSDDDLAFTDMDIEAVELFQSMMAAGLADVDSAVQTARVVGLSMARIAEAETSPGSTPVLTPSGDSIIDADNFARRAGAAGHGPSARVRLATAPPGGGQAGHVGPDQRVRRRDQPHDRRGVRRHGRLHRAEPAPGR
jgi:hypothetical protein